ncbi:hypothetical protein ACFE04_016669 [Oxalis oulophora]
MQGKAINAMILMLVLGTLMLTGEARTRLSFNADAPIIPTSADIGIGDGTLMLTGEARTRLSFHDDAPIIPTPADISIADDVYEPNEHCKMICYRDGCRIVCHD